jgi:tetratricopeptide (TPR) repeat protein
MTRWRTLTASFRESPTTVPALVAIAVLIVWATSQAGYPLTHWAPGGLIVLALLAMGLVAAPPSLQEMPMAVRVALACLLAYTALSFLSILWAGVPGDAWEGADRTLLYLLVFALFALWRGRAWSAAVLLGVWTVAMIVLAVYVAVRVDLASGRSFVGLFAEERLAYPSGYPNATAAQWLMAFWPALLFARSERIPWGLRGLLAGGSVLLADLALLSQSRGSLYATGVMIVLVFAFVPGRLRTFVTAIPVTLAIAVTTPIVLRVGDRLQSGQSAGAALSAAVAAMLAAALLVGLLTGLGAAFESRPAFSPALASRARRGVAVAAVATLVAVLAGGLAAASDPIARVRSAWHSFKAGYPATEASGSRLVSGLGSNRYDFYRVALDEFVAHPVLGIGTDNFAQQYLAHGRSGETPRYPHSVELRTLTQTGVLGALLALAGLSAALLAGARAMRRSDRLGRAVAAAALGGFAYWAVHGSFDWFFEFAGLGAAAFALLGLACSIDPGRPARPRPASGGGTGSAAALSIRGTSVHPGRTRMPGRARARGLALGALLAAAALAACVSLAAPWLSQRRIDSAARIWPRAPLAAYARLSDAARLNPLSAEAYLVAGSIALRFGDLARADRQFSLALQRTPDDAYATLERGAIASARAEQAAALALLTRALRLNPKDALARQALTLARRGGRVNIEQLNRSIFLRAQLRQ